MSEFEMQNAEAMGVVRGGQRLPRKKCHFVSEETYRYLMGVEAAKERAEQNLHKTWLACAAAAPVLIAVSACLGHLLA